VEQQDREQQDKQSEGNTGDIHNTDPSWRVRTKRRTQTNSLKSLSEGKLQMDWLRSEDLKEEKR
jgi:hypothetical protein